MNQTPQRYHPPTHSLPSSTAERDTERERQTDRARCTQHTSLPPACSFSPSVTTDSPPIHHRLPHPGMADGFTPSWQCYITPLTSSSVRQVNFSEMYWGGERKSSCCSADKRASSQLPCKRFSIFRIAARLQSHFCIAETTAGCMSLQSSENFYCCAYPPDVCSDKWPSRGVA